LLLTPGENIQRLFYADDLLPRASDRCADLLFATNKLRDILRESGFIVAIAIKARPELTVLRQALRGGIEPAMRRGPLGFTAADFLIGGTRLGEVGAGGDELLRELISGDGIGQLAVPAAMLGQSGCSTPA
jgi:hypothetical protein